MMVLLTFLAPGSGLDFMVSLFGGIFDTSSVALVMISSTNLSATLRQTSIEVDWCVVPLPLNVTDESPFETGSLVCSVAYPIFVFCGNGKRMDFSTWKNERHTYTDIGTSSVGSCVDQISNLILQLTSSSFLFFVESSGIELFSSPSLIVKTIFDFYRKEH